MCAWTTLPASHVNPDNQYTREISSLGLGWWLACDRAWSSDRPTEIKCSSVKSQDIGAQLMSLIRELISTHKLLVYECMFVEWHRASSC